MERSILEMKVGIVSNTETEHGKTLGMQALGPIDGRMERSILEMKVGIVSNTEIELGKKVLGMQALGPIRDQQRFGLGLAGLALSKPNRLSLNRLGIFKPEPNRTEPIPKPV